MLTKERLTEMWRAGYCLETVRHAERAESAQERVGWLQRHVELGCKECRNANLMKHLEAETAAAMGPQGTSVFNEGGDITKLAGFHEAREQVMLHAVSTRLITSEWAVWVMRTAEARAGQELPDGPE